MNRKMWKLTNEEYEFIKGEVAFIFEKYQIRCTPVSGFEIATKMGIKLIPYSALTETQQKLAREKCPDGYVIETNDGRKLIYYNDIDWSYEHQNWTILHEIGHIVLDHRGIDQEKEEDEADFFAKYAIAPPILVHKIGAESPLDIYENFDISLEASVYAYHYYESWRDGYFQVGRLTEYEKKILKTFSA